MILGTMCGLFSATIYTCANICLKSVSHCDPFWVACLRSLPTTVVAAALVGFRLTQGQPFGLAPRTVFALIGVGLAAQLGGNVGFQYALEGCGLALAVPLTLGTIIIGGASLGRLWLGEPITVRTALAILFLLIAIPILTFGAKEEAADMAATTVASDSMNHAAVEQSPLLWLFGALSACGAGICYALQGVMLRRMANLRAPTAATLLILSSVGLLSLGPISVGRIGWDGLLATTPHELKTMLYAGIFNAAGFFAISKALEWISVVHLNALNATQAAMAAAAGVVFFHEEPTVAMFLGVALTIGGLLLMDRKRQPAEIATVE